jgi:hypothetical protein
MLCGFVFMPFFFIYLGDVFSGFCKKKLGRILQMLTLFYFCETSMDMLLFHVYYLPELSPCNYS